MSRRLLDGASVARNNLQPIGVGGAVKRLLALRANRVSGRHHCTSTSQWKPPAIPNSKIDHTITSDQWVEFKNRALKTQGRVAG